MPKVQKPVPRTLGAFTWFIFKEILSQRRWLLFPVWVLLGIIALLMLFGGSASLLPSIYVSL